MLLHAFLTVARIKSICFENFYFAIYKKSTTKAET